VAAPCARNLATHLRDRGPGSELITVTATRYRTTWATLSTWQRRGGCWTRALGPFRARIGRSGLNNDRHEGDGSTPTGLYALGRVLYGIDPASPNPQYRYHHLVCGDWWDEDPASAHYNSFEHVPCGNEPSWGPESEALWTEAPAYDDFAVVEFNSPPHGPRGSGIFLHDGIDAPTSGCVSLSPSDLGAVLGWLRTSRHPRIAIGTVSEIRRF